jgi:acyl carrier protein
MTTDDKLKQVMSAVLRVPADAIDDATSPDTIEEWSSLAHLDLILAIEEEFGVTIPDEEVGDLTSYRLLRLTLDEQGVAAA